METPSDEDSPEPVLRLMAEVLEDTTPVEMGTVDSEVVGTVRQKVSVQICKVNLKILTTVFRAGRRFSARRLGTCH